MTSRILKMLGLDGILENAEGYIDSRIQLIKLEAEEKLTHFLTKLLVGILVLFLFTMALVFLGLGLATYLNAILESSFAGYLIVGLFFLLLIFVVVMSSAFIHKKLLELMTSTQKKNNT